MQTTAAALLPSVAIWWSSLDILLLFIFTVNGAKAPQNAASEHRMVMQDRAILHVNLMNTAGMCRDPRPVIVYPQATNNKIYYPRGTVSYNLFNFVFLQFAPIVHFVYLIYTVAAPVLRPDRLLPEHRRSLPPGCGGRRGKGLLRESPNHSRPAGDRPPTDASPEDAQAELHHADRVAAFRQSHTLQVREAGAKCH